MADAVKAIVTAVKGQTGFMMSDLRGKGLNVPGGDIGGVGHNHIKPDIHREGLKPGPRYNRHPGDTIKAPGIFKGGGRRIRRDIHRHILMSGLSPGKGNNQSTRTRSKFQDF